MGAWGCKSFENDDAIDWARDFLSSRDPMDLISATLEVVKLESRLNVSAYAASRGVAAAEVVAALIGKPSSSLPGRITEWAASPGVELDMARVQSALEVVGVIETSSSLRDLWSEGGDTELWKNWKSEIQDLRLRLTNPTALRS